MQFNISQREVVLKLVYYGPALSGKTTNLQVIHTLVNPECRGRLMTLDTHEDRTLFFDLLPVFFDTASGMKVKLKLYTVPGQVIHDATRRMVLAGADAVAFIADSQRNQIDNNHAAFKNLVENLRKNGVDPAEIPIAIQFNKRDLPDIQTDAEVDEFKAQSPNPVFKAIALQGLGVVETLFGLLAMTFDSLEKKHEFSNKFGIQKKEFLANIFKHLDLSVLANRPPQGLVPNAGSPPTKS
ncbi:MAG: Mutual gliding-motility protein MglA [Myxococcota bacterium]|nr:Mutual gliding-motility protein MglA [Myxococcota bacterium]